MTSPLRVLQVIDGLWVGGTERSLVEAVPILARHGVEVDIACLRHRDEGVEDLVPPEHLFFLAGRTVPSQARSLRRLVRERKPALLHSSLFRANMVTRLGAIGTGIPVLNSLVNDSYAPDRLRDPRVRRWRLRVTQCIDLLSGWLLVDHYHAVSQTIARAARRRLAIPEKRVTVVRRGRDPERFEGLSSELRQRVREKLGIPNEAPVVINVARQEFQKAQDSLLQAAAVLRTRWPDLVVLIVGRPGGASSALLATVDELSLADTVRFLGHREDIPELLATADVFALPSHYEGFPGAVIEAMAAGLPVVATDIGPLLELVEPGRSALLVEPGSSKALTAALERVLTSPDEAASLGTRGRQLFVERLTIGESGRALAALYFELCGRGSEGPV